MPLKEMLHFLHRDGEYLKILAWRLSLHLHSHNWPSFHPHP